MTFLKTCLAFADAAPASGKQAEAAAAVPPVGSHTLVTDTLASPGHFVLYHLLATAVTAKAKVVWVDFRAEGKASLDSVMKKLGVAVTPASNSFTFIEPSVLDASTSPSKPALFDDAGSPTLKSVYDALSSALLPPTTEGEGPLVVLDGLAELLHIGFEPQSVSLFVRAALALARKSGSRLISALHADPKTSPVSPETELLGRLTRLGGGGWIRISDLASGRSGDVHGEMTSYPLWPAPGVSFPSIPDAHPLQYRLEDRTVKVFPKGTGRGFL